MRNMELAHTKTVEEVLETFNVDEHVGLTDSQVAKAREKYGPNGRYTVVFHLFYFSVSFRHFDFVCVALICHAMASMISVCDVCAVFFNCF